LKRIIDIEVKAMMIFHKLDSTKQILGHNKPVTMAIPILKFCILLWIVLC